MDFIFEIRTSLSRPCLALTEIGHGVILGCGIVHSALHPFSISLVSPCIVLVFPIASIGNQRCKAASPVTSRCVGSLMTVSSYLMVPDDPNKQCHWSVSPWSTTQRPIQQAVPQGLGGKETWMTCSSLSRGRMSSNILLLAFIMRYEQPNRIDRF